MSIDARFYLSVEENPNTHHYIVDEEIDTIDASICFYGDGLAYSNILNNFIENQAKVHINEDYCDKYVITKKDLKELYSKCQSVINSFYKVIENEFGRLKFNTKSIIEVLSIYKFLNEDILPNIDNRSDSTKIAYIVG